MRLSVRKGAMKVAKATNFNRKSGEGFCCYFCALLNVPVLAQLQGSCRIIISPVNPNSFCWQR
jgi:hypothetical protein